MRRDILEQKELIIKMVTENYSKAAIAKVLNCKSTTLNSYLKKMGIVYNGNIGSSNVKRRQYIPVEELLNKNSTISSYRLKQKLIKENMIEVVCSCCKLTEWMGKPIPLELDHIDGDNTNNEFTNLRMLCPNCHAQTETYRGKNTKKARKRRDIDLILQENTPILIDDKLVDKMVKIPKVKKCKKCEANYTGKASTYCSIYCKQTDSRSFDISKEELQKLVWSIPTTKIAEKFGVSDKAIEKRCRLLSVEKPPRGYWAKQKKNN